MKLLVDIGNSRLKWAWLERGELLDPGSVSHGGRVPPPGAVDAAGRHPVEILVASVVTPALTSAMAEGLGQAFAAPVRIAQTEVLAAGVRNGYIEPGQLGVDRWLAMLAACSRYRMAVCVVDAGTALTLDAVARDGRHLGGMIVPGPALMRRALVRETGGIGSAADLLSNSAAIEGAGRDFWGQDTESCMRLGAAHAAACLVENCAKALTRSIGQPSVLVLTGGDAPALQSALTIPAEHRPLLVLEGLALRHGDS